MNESRPTSPVNPSPNRPTAGAAPVCCGVPRPRLWLIDGTNEDGKVVANPNIGYSVYTITYADGSSREFYRIGLSANTTGISVYALGLDDKTYLARTYGASIGEGQRHGLLHQVQTPLSHQCRCPSGGNPTRDDGRSGHGLRCDLTPPGQRAPWKYALARLSHSSPMTTTDTRIPMAEPPEYHASMTPKLPTHAVAIRSDIHDRDEEARLPACPPATQKRQPR